MSLLILRTYFLFRRMGMKPATAWKLAHRGPLFFITLR